MDHSYIELWQSVKDSKWYFVKKSGNHKVVLTSQGYKQKRYAKEAIKRDHPGVRVKLIQRWW